MKNQLLIFLSICCLLACHSDKKEESTIENFPFDYELDFQPNIIWLVAEDLSPVIPSFGDSTIQTPHLSRLAAEGVCYDNVFSPSPVCAPSRAALATGMYPTHIAANHMRTGPWFRTDVPEARLKRKTSSFPDDLYPYEALPPEGVRMFSEYLREKGYYCTNNSKQDYQFRCSVTAWDETSTKAHWKNRKPNQPFFAIFNYGITHESQIWARAKDSSWVAEDLAMDMPPYLPDTEIGRKDLRQMYSNIKRMDHQVGEMLKELEEANLLEKTIIVWYTDHGGPLPRQKRLLYDSGLKVPMIIRFPNKLFAGQRDDRLISFIDFGPTALSMAGIQPPADLDGKAFLGKYRRTKEPAYIFAAADRFDANYDCNRAVRDRHYKYIKYYNPEKPMFLRVTYREQQPIMQELHRLRAAGKLSPEQALWFRPTKPAEELFDTQKDPHELNNLAENPHYREKLLALRAKEQEWVHSFEDTGLMPEKELLKKLRPGNKELKVAQPTLHIKEDKATLACATAGATIGYKINGTNSSKVQGWTIYQEPIKLEKGDTLTWVGDRIGYRYSEIGSVKY
jgi:arylsulfatase A-like enzyme